jgi:hypothetical protein
MNNNNNNSFLVLVYILFFIKYAYLNFKTLVLLQKKVEIKKKLIETVNPDVNHDVFS